MHANSWIELMYAEVVLPNASATVYDFNERHTESGRRRHIKALEHENALLTRMVSEIGIDIEGLRALLAVS